MHVLAEVGTQTGDNWEDMAEAPPLGISSHCLHWYIIKLWFRLHKPELSKPGGQIQASNTCPIFVHLLTAKLVYIAIDSAIKQTQT